VARRNECLEVIRNELRSAGIRAYKVEPTGSKHIRVTWYVNNIRRSVVSSGTASDWRAARNARSYTRRLLRQDALLVD